MLWIKVTFRHRLDHEVEGASWRIEVGQVVGAYLEGVAMRNAGIDAYNEDNKNINSLLRIRS